MSIAADLPSLSLADYAIDLAHSGTPVFGRTSTDFWVRHESLAVMRVPLFEVARPAPQPLSRVLWGSPALVASYLLEPDQHHAANAWLYVCRDRDYSIEKLAPAMRRNVRRGLRELRIEPVSLERLLDSGFQAFSDTRSRVGVSDGTPEEFVRRFTARGKCRAHGFLGAWHGQALAAFLSITAIDDWAEIEGCFSANAALALRPNDTLMATALSTFRVERRCALVSYGLSSVQAVSNAAGLHEFKTKVGFEARPVHRAFTPHPLLRPFVNPITERCVSTLLRVTPENRLLKKCDGMLSTMLGRRVLRDVTR